MSEERCEYSDLFVSQCAHCPEVEPGPVEPPAKTAEVRYVVAWTPAHDRAPVRPTHGPPPVELGGTGARQCRCGRPVRNNAVVCATCSHKLATALGEVEWLDEELNTTISGQRACALGGGSPSVEQGLHWHDRAADAQRELRTYLVAWTRLCDEEEVRHRAPTSDLPEDTLPSMARYLRWRVDGLAMHPAGDDAVDEITRAVHTCLRLIDRHPEREFIGPCNCGRDLYRRPGQAQVECRWCHWVVTASEMLTWMSDQMEGRLVTVREGVGLLGRFGLPVASETVKSWVKRGHLAQAGDNLEGRHLYQLNEMITLASRSAVHVDMKAAAP